MTNELLLIGSVIFIFGSVLVAYRAFGRSGLYCLSGVIMVLANVEALLLINAFGMEQTLGNVLFAASFLITDILSECEGKRAANKAVTIGMFISAFFLLLSQSWLLYTPSSNDWVAPAMAEVFSNTPRMMIASFSVYAISQFFDVWLYHKWWALTEKPNDWVAPAMAEVFSNTPRMMIASFSVYAISQFFDVWLYHKWWALTEKLTGNRQSFLWLRNTGSTLISQIINTALFTLFAFWGTYDVPTLLSIFASSYVIYIVTSILDTPAVYLARIIDRRRKAKGQLAEKGAAA